MCLKSQADHIQTFFCVKVLPTICFSEKWTMNMISWATSVIASQALQVRSFTGTRAVAIILANTPPTRMPWVRTEPTPNWSNACRFNSLCWLTSHNMHALLQQVSFYNNTLASLSLDKWYNIKKDHGRGWVTDKSMHYLQNLHQDCKPSEVVIHFFWGLHWILANVSQRTGVCWFGFQAKSTPTH